MKIALVLNGIARDVLAGSRAFRRHLFQDHDVDVFASVWEGGQCELIPQVYPTLQRLQILDPAEISGCPPSIFNVFSNWYGMQSACFSLREFCQSQGVTYDWIVRSRPDLELQFDVEWAELDAGSYWMSSAHWGHTPQFVMDDNLAVCRPETYFRLYLDLFDWYRSLPIHFPLDSPEVRLALRVTKIGLQSAVRRHMSLDYIVARHPAHE